MAAPKSLSFLLLLGVIISCHSDDNQQSQLRRTLQTPVTPTVAPTFLDDPRCPLRIATSRCEALVESTGLEEVAGCDCYQFCGDAYLGCCDLRDTSCTIECDTNVDPVAGCRLDGIVDETDPACSATLQDGTGTVLEFEEGDSYGDLISTDCGSATDFPCFCNTLSENDGIRCPYCPFVTDEDRTICARNGESITFVGAGGVNQVCSCNYFSNNVIGTFCEPIDEPVPAVCGLQRKTEQCAEVTEFVNPIEGCDCYNFCEGAYTGCCNYADETGDSPCTATCPTSASTADIVAGCEIDPSKPPVTPPPVDPSDAPTAAPLFCGAQLNTQNCPQLTLNQLPVDDCDCYNYCDSEFTGCCAFDDFACSASCTNAVLTSGCQLPVSPSTCRGYGAPCSEFSDCCSGRCLFDTCQRPANLADTKTKLSDGRGGAGGIVKDSGVRRHLTKDKVKIRGM
jgi:hypothetical protein